MIAAVRGPSGAVNAPPSWLHQASLPIDTWPRGETFVRIHRTAHQPVFFSPGVGRPPLGRFDSEAGQFGVLYAAQDFACAFAETVLRNPQRRLIAAAEIAGRSLAVLAASRAMRLVGLHGPGLQQLGLDNAITTGPYAPCGQWADALFIHPDCPDGLAYASRHDPETRCVAIFERSDLAIAPVSEPVPLETIPADTAKVLRRYGKGLDP